MENGVSFLSGNKKLPKLVIINVGNSSKISRLKVLTKRLPTTPHVPQTIFSVT